MQLENKDTPKKKVPVNPDLESVKVTVSRFPALLVSTQIETPPVFCLSFFVLLCPSKGTSLVVQWLKLCIPNAGASGLILGQETKIPLCHMAATNKTVSRCNFYSECERACVCVCMCVLAPMPMNELLNQSAILVCYCCC